MILAAGFVMEKIQRRFGAGIGAWLRSAVAEAGCTRSSLARGLCEFADWRNAKGDFCLASARHALPALAADLGVRLPAARPAPSPVGRVPSDPVPDPRIEAPLDDLGAVRLELASGAADVRAWRSMMAQRHPQGALYRIQAGRSRWSRAGANALLAVKCCFENRRWADFLEWKTGRVAAA